MHLQPHPVGEHGVGRPEGEHRLPGRGDHADAPELVGPRAGAGRRPLRMERLSADQGAAARRRIRSKGFVATANNYLFPPDYPYKEALHYTGADPYRASRISEVLGVGAAAHRRRHDAAAERQRVAAGAQPGAAPARQTVSDPQPRSHRPSTRRVRCCSRGTSASTPTRSPPASTRCGSGALTANIRNLVVPKEAQPFVGQPSMKRVIDWLNAPDGRFGRGQTSGGASQTMSARLRDATSCCREASTRRSPS